MEEEMGTYYIPSKIFSAEFSLAVGCELNCRFCPQQKLVCRYVDLYGNNDIYMSFNTFETCLKKIESGAGITFGGMVEPFHNKECAKMIKYAYDLGYKISIDTTLVGATEKDFEILKNVHFEYFLLHIPDQEGNSKFNITDEYLRIFKKFSNYFKIDRYSCHGETHKAVRKYLKDDVKIDSTMMNRAGNLDYKELKTYDHKGQIVCGCGAVNRGWIPIIQPNGIVVLCCMDYGLEHVLGNLLIQDWDEILCGKEFLLYESGMENEKLPSLCRKCPAAVQKGDPRLGNSKLFGTNAIRIARILEDYKNGNTTEDELRKKHSSRSVDIIKMLVDSKNICVFGLGKLFNDNYYQSLWYNVIKANIFSDNNDTKWGNGFRGIKCIAPIKLINFDNLLVITYVKDYSDIHKQLKEMGIMNIINIYEIFELCY